MQGVSLHARPSIIQVGCPTSCYQVCALNHAKGGNADLDYPPEPCYRNEKCVSLIEITVNPIKYFNIHVNDRVSITNEKDHMRVMSPCVQYVSVHYSCISWQCDTSNRTRRHSH